jgi:hypothetical protein
MDFLLGQNEKKRRRNFWKRKKKIMK